MNGEDTVWRKEKSVVKPTEFNGFGDWTEGKPKDPIVVGGPNHISSQPTSGKGRPGSKKSSRDWCYTYWGPESSIDPGLHEKSTVKFGDHVWLETLHDIPTNAVVYHVFQFEISPDTGGRHIQGFISFATRRRFATVRKVLPRCHLAPRRGTVNQAADYCMKTDSKDGDYQFEYGTRPEDDLGQGHRSDIDAIKELIDEGASMKMVADHDFGYYVRNHRGLNQYRSISTKGRNKKSLVFLFVGGPGTGKSAAADSFMDNYAVPPGSSGTVWYDEYEPGHHKTVIFDDFTGAWCQWRELLRLTDAYKMLVNTKGGHIPFKPEAIVFTANYSPERWYSNEAVPDKAPFMRRVDYHWQYYLKHATNAEWMIPDAVRIALLGFEERHPMLPVHSVCRCLKGDPTYHPHYGRYCAFDVDGETYYAVISQKKPEVVLPKLWV